MPEIRAAPVQANKGAPILGPHNLARKAENPDLIAPPPTDQGSVPNLRFSFADAQDARRRLVSSGDASHELPVATTIAGVNMRLTAGGVRELHWQ